MPDFYEMEAAEEQKQRIYFEQKGRCWVCGKRLVWPWDCAHRIPKHKWILKKYGKEVIHHRKNLRGTCRGACNDAVMISPEKMEGKELLAEIMEDLKNADESI